MTEPNPVVWRDRVKEMRRVTAAELLANPRNWREHPDDQRKALRSVLEEVGIAGALLARETPDGLELIDGHLRTDMDAATEWPVLVLDVDQQEADVILATFDPIAAMAKRGDEALRELLAGIDSSNGGLAELLGSLQNQLPIPTEAPKPGGDALPREVKKRCERGDVWKLGRHRLICGDSRSAADVARLMAGERINVGITSPPYASQRKYDESSGFKPIHPDAFVEWFGAVQANVATHLADDGSWFVNIKENCADGQRVLYVKDLTLAHVREWGWRFVDEFIWTHGGTPKAVNQRFKNGFEPIFQFTRGRHKFYPGEVMHATDDVPDWSGLHPNAEAIQKLGCTEGMRRQGVDARTTQSRDGRKSGSLSENQGLKNQVGGDTSSDGLAYPSNVLSFGKNREALGHAAAYPVSLPEFFCKAYSAKDDVIFDPFMGSGTTLIAAEHLGRRGFGVELSAEYCDVILQRWEDFTEQTAELLERVADGGD